MRFSPEFAGSPTGKGEVTWGYTPSLLNPVTLFSLCPTLPFWFRALGKFLTLILQEVMKQNQVRLANIVFFLICQSKDT